MLTIRPATLDDAPALSAIYNYYIEQTIVTFEEVPVTVADFAQRIQSIQSYGLPWIVGEVAGQVIGYAYAGPWKQRSAYRHSVESTVYLSHTQFGNGFGTQFYRQLFAELKQRKIHVIIGGIALPNPASVALHEKLGMVKVAHYAEIGHKFGNWIDVGYWQCTLPVTD